MEIRENSRRCPQVAPASYNLLITMATWKISHRELTISFINNSEMVPQERRLVPESSACFSTFRKL